jgi:hypothetical protein
VFHHRLTNQQGLPTPASPFASAGGWPALQTVGQASRLSHTSRTADTAVAPRADRRARNLLRALWRNRLPDGASPNARNRSAIPPANRLVLTRFTIGWPINRAFPLPHRLSPVPAVGQPYRSPPAFRRQTASFGRVSPSADLSTGLPIRASPLARAGG